MQEQEIRIEECKSERLLVYPYDFSKDDISEIFSHLKDIWGIEQIRMGMGSLISLDNVYKMNFDKYEGIYTIALNKKSVPNIFAVIKRVHGINCQHCINRCWIMPIKIIYNLLATLTKLV